MERSKAESFTAYLEARQKERDAPAVPASGGTSLGLLAALAGAPRQWTRCASNALTPVIKNENIRERTVAIHSLLLQR